MATFFENALLWFCFFQILLECNLNYQALFTGKTTGPISKIQDWTCMITTKPYFMVFFKEIGLK